MKVWGDEFSEAPHANSPTSAAVTGLRRRFVWISLLVAAVLLSGVGWQIRRSQASRATARGVLPGEFEHHEALLLVWNTLADADHFQTKAEIAQAAWRQTQLVLLVLCDEDIQHAGRWLEKVGVPISEVKFVRLPFDSVSIDECSRLSSWVRDYGPLVTKSFCGDYQVVDFYCSDRLDQPTLADFVSPSVAESFGMTANTAALTVSGGQLLSNGAGLCICSDTVLEQNQLRGYGEAEVSALLGEYAGASQVVYLEPLQGEATMHVDMFATFTAPDSVVIGQYSPEVDPINAEILDRNAERLHQIRTACGPLNVTRLPMPARPDNEWRTYANVVYVNGVLLVPRYPGSDPEEEERAFAVYQELLPDWQIVGIDSSRLIKNCGSLHCATQLMYRIESQDLYDLDSGPIGGE